jgi:hypothetical protein
MVYFIGSTVPGVVKIGHSDNPERRLSQLQTGNAEPLEVLATCPGGECFEELLHETFKDDLQGGEWFRISNRLGTLINELRRELGSSPIMHGKPPTQRGVIARLRDELNELSGGDKAKELEILISNPRHFKRLMPKTAYKYYASGARRRYR